MGDEQSCSHPPGDEADPLEKIAEQLRVSFNPHEKQFIYRAAYYFKKDREFRHQLMEEEEASKYASLNDLIAEFDSNRHLDKSLRRTRDKDALRNKAYYFEAHAVRTAISFIEYPVTDPADRHALISKYIRAGGPLQGLEKERVPLYRQALQIHFGIDGARPKFRILSDDVAKHLAQGDFVAATYQRGILCDWIDYVRKQHDIPFIATSDLTSALTGMKEQAIGLLLNHAMTFRNEPAKRDQYLNQALEIPKFDIFRGMSEYDSEIKDAEDFSWVENKVLDIAKKS